MKITLEEVIKFCEDEKIGYGQTFPIYGVKYDKPCEPTYRVTQRWETGGLSGGNCWNNDEPQHYTSSTPAPEAFDDFDKLVEKFLPSISFIKYKRLYSELVTSSSNTEHEYYGNSTDYTTREFNLLSFIEKINETN